MVELLVIANINFHLLNINSSQKVTFLDLRIVTMLENIVIALTLQGLVYYH